MNNNRFKFRVWDADMRKYLVGEFLVGGCGDMVRNVVDCENFLNKGNYIIEQCTGLKDKNGDLIYAGDVVKYYWGAKTNTGFICWNDDFAGFYIVNNEEHCIESPHCLMNVVNKKNIEIIGNIHKKDE